MRPKKGTQNSNNSAPEEVKSMVYIGFSKVLSNMDFEYFVCVCVCQSAHSIKTNCQKAFLSSDIRAQITQIALI